MKKFLLFSIFVSSIAHAAVPLEKIKLALNWKAEPEFGGFYEALDKGYYKEQGFDVEILEGGSGTPTTQMLVNGTVDLAIVSSEELILQNDRDPARRLIGVFSAFEKSPYMIMAHEESGYKNLSEVFAKDGQQISLQKGLPYVDFLLNKFKPVKAQVVPYAGGIALFTQDKKLAQQGFIFAEALQAELAGLKVKTWLVANEGFNPYLVLLAVSEKNLKSNSDKYTKFVKATRQGWQSYLKNPKQTNTLLNKKNPSMKLEVMTASMDKVKSLALFPKELPQGAMTDMRWDEQVKIMKDLKLIKSDLKPADLFKNLY